MLSIPLPLAIHNIRFDAGVPRRSCLASLSRDASNFATGGNFTEFRNTPRENFNAAAALAVKKTGAFNFVLQLNGEFHTVEGPKRMDLTPGMLRLLPSLPPFVFFSFVRKIETYRERFLNIFVKCATKAYSI